MALADTVWVSVLGVALWELQMGVTQGLVAAAIADAAPAHLRGAAFGIYYFVDGVASLLASSDAGLLWHIGGARLAFGVGAVLAALVVLMILFGRLPQAPAAGATPQTGSNTSI